MRRFAHDRHAEQGHLLVGDCRALPSSPSAARCSCAWRGRPASGSAQAGSIAATVRANSRLVSTSSAPITAAAASSRAPSRGRSTNRVLRAPRYSACGAALRSARARPRRSTARRLRVVEQADVREQPREQRPVDAVGVRLAGLLGHVQAERLGEPHELPVEVLPLAHAQVVEVLGACTAAGTRCAPSSRCCSSRWFQRLSRVRKSLVGSANRACSPSACSRRFSSGRSRRSWMVSPATIASTSRDDALRLRLDQHAREARVDRQPRRARGRRVGELRRRRRRAPSIERAELEQQVERRP